MNIKDNDIEELKKLLADVLDQYIVIKLHEDGIQILTAFDEEELVDIFQQIMDLFKTSQQVNVHNRNTH